jgi:hypothetical protein
MMNWRAGRENAVDGQKGFVQEPGPEEFGSALFLIRN